MIINQHNYSILWMILDMNPDLMYYVMMFSERALYEFFCNFIWLLHWTFFCILWRNFSLEIFAKVDLEHMCATKIWNLSIWCLASSGIHIDCTSVCFEKNRLMFLGKPNLQISISINNIDNAVHFWIMYI